MLTIWQVTSPNIVELWEAILTFLCFPILVFVAYLIDKGYFCKNKVRDQDTELANGESFPHFLCYNVSINVYNS